MVSIEFASVTIAILIMYLFLYDNETRWKRLAGSFGIMICSIGLGVVSDTIPMYILMSANMLIALLKLVEDTATIIETVK